MSQSSDLFEEDPRIVDAKARYKAAFDAKHYDLVKDIQLEINGHYARQSAAAPAGNYIEFQF